MECAVKGRGYPCVPGPPKRRCGNCGAFAYCSKKHQKLHWYEYDHKEACPRFEQQMQQAALLIEFPFSFSENSEFVECENHSIRCSVLASFGIHLKALWKFECSCWSGAGSLDNNSRLIDGWNLPSSLCPCGEPKIPLSNSLQSWEHYYQWRNLPFCSPVALLLHWPLTIFHCFQLCVSPSLISDAVDKLCIHYLGPEKELSQLAVFGELRTLLPNVQLHIEFVGPEVPQLRDGETIKLDTYVHCSDENCYCKSSSQERSSHTNSAVTLKLHKGFYHEKYRYMDAHPQLIIAPNAGIAAYTSWLPSIVITVSPGNFGRINTLCDIQELISEMGIPAMFTDYCEEAAYMAVRCIYNVIGRPLSFPYQVNPFRQPMAMENQAHYLPCYSNCFLFGINT